MKLYDAGVLREYRIEVNIIKIFDFTVEMISNKFINNEN